VTQTTISYWQKKKNLLATLAKRANERRGDIKAGRGRESGREGGKPNGKAGVEKEVGRQALFHDRGEERKKPY
jgi:hypothetical protein